MTIKDTVKAFVAPLIPYIIGTIVFLVIIGGLGWAILNPGKDYVTKMIGEMVKQQHDIIIQNDKNEIDALKTQVSEVRQQNNVLDKQYATLKKQVGALKNDIANNKPPKTSQERTDRLNKLGLHPIN